MHQRMLAPLDGSQLAPPMLPHASAQATCFGAETVQCTELCVT